MGWKYFFGIISVLCFGTISKKEFLDNYWQKKPLVIRQALPDFVNQLTAYDLAGLSMEEEVESRLVRETPNSSPFWHLQDGPFLEKDFKILPESHWTLLVQGVDRFIPELALLFDNFNFIPQWRVDDLMISYAVESGSVGPHYDNYDVFLYQATGSRKWSLTTQGCHVDNYMPNVALRIMQKFAVEEEFILNEGDMLYLPPKVGHNGRAISGDCMTYSFGYRSYANQELWDDFGDYNSEHHQKSFYQDPNWQSLSATSHIPQEAWLNARQQMQNMLNNEENLKSWFGCFITNLDQQAQNLLPEPSRDTLNTFMQKIMQNDKLTRENCCRFAYFEEVEPARIRLFINGEEWDVSGVSVDLIKLIANNRTLPMAKIRPWLSIDSDKNFLFEMWRLQWLEVVKNESISQ